MNNATAPGIDLSAIYGILIDVFLRDMREQDTKVDLDDEEIVDGAEVQVSVES